MNRFQKQLCSEMIHAMMRASGHQGVADGILGRCVMRRMSVLLSVVVLLSSVVLISRSPAVAQEATPAADLEANKALAQRFHDEIFEQGNLAVADEILAPDFAWFNPPDQADPTIGPEGVNQSATDVRAFFSDLVLTDDDVIAEGDRVVIRWTLTGTAQTEAGPVPVRFSGIDIFRIEDGKIAELWQLTDDLTLEEQLSAPAATPAAATPAA
jgi:ketosteroid isomerase-like protein